MARLQAIDTKVAPRMSESDQVAVLLRDDLFARFLMDGEKYVTATKDPAEVAVERARTPRLYRQLKRRADALVWQGTTPPRGIYRPTLEKRLEQLARLSRVPSST